MTTVIIIYSVVGFGSVIGSFLFLRIRKERHLHNFKSNYEELQWALKNKNIEKIIQYSTPLLWNDFMERKDYKILKNNIEELINTNPDLVDLEREIHLLFEKKGWN